MLLLSTVYTVFVMLRVLALLSMLASQTVLASLSLRSTGLKSFVKLSTLAESLVRLSLTLKRSVADEPKVALVSVVNLDASIVISAK